MLPKAALPEKRAKPPARDAHKNRSGTTGVKSLNSTNDYSSSAVALRVIGALGTNTVASLLGVNKDRASRWARTAPLIEAMKTYEQGAVA